MKICPNCHTENKDVNKFCVKCGLPFATDLSSNNGVSHSQPYLANKVPDHLSRNILYPSPRQPQISKNGKYPQKQPYQPTRTYCRTSRSIRQPQRRNSNEDRKNFIPILLTILSLAVIVGAIIFWMFRDSLFKSNVKDFTTDTVVVEEINKETAFDVTKTISSNDIIYLSGLINSKYPVHMILDLYRRIGVYYYDKYGSSNLIGIEISQLSDQGNGQWNLTLIKQTDNDDNGQEWHGTLSSEKFIGNGEFLNKEMPFDLEVDSVLSDAEDPLIKKNNAKEAKWHTCVFDGTFSAGEKVFNVRINAQSNQKDEFKNATYHNLSYNISFPVDVKMSYDNLYVTGKSEHNGFRIEATRNNGRFEGYIYDDNRTLPISLKFTEKST